MRSFIPFILLLAAAVLLIAAPARAQTTLDKTTLGEDQNDERDYINSLQPGPVKNGKGEKRTQVAAAELKSKSIKDSTFGGSLLNMGIDAAAPKLDETKLHNAQTEVEPAASKQRVAATTEKSTTGATKQSVEAKEPATADRRPEGAAQPVENQDAFSNLSTTATLADTLSEADAAAAQSNISSSSSDTHNKDQGGSSTEKTPTATSSDKSSDTKPNGEH